MGSPQENTKIEQIAEAIESLVLATAASLAATGFHVSPSKSAQLQTGIENARQELSSALRDFLQPSLRVVTSKTEVIGDVSSSLTRVVESFGARP